VVNLTSSTPDVLIAGAGIIGLSLALELHSRGAHVQVLERDTALSHASTAAAGMLALHDPHNPAALLPLAQFSTQLYPGFLQRIQQLSGFFVTFHTETTLQYSQNGSTVRLAEHSLDPRQLAAALHAAIRANGILLQEHTALQGTEELPNGICAYTSTGQRICPKVLVIATGAWAQSIPIHTMFPLAPRKGQMLQVALPPSLRDLCEVHRSNDIYIVPRTVGPQGGTALIGATIEDAGFDTSTHTRDLTHLRSLAAGLLPAFASERDAPQLEAWAGLRPTTPDRLPVIGRGHNSEWIATGHYRNGILLAPATAVVLADLIEGKMPALDLSPFLPNRFASS